MRTHRGMVLVLDDNLHNRILAGDSLTDAGYKVLLAEDGEQALSIIGKHKPDVIVLDIMMPGLDGYEVCRVLRGDRRLGNLKIIFLSAKSQPEDKVKGLEDCGGDDYLTKPYMPAELTARVNTQYRAKKAMDELDAVNTVIKADLTLGAAMQRQFLTREDTVKTVFAKVGYDVAIYNQAPETISGDFYCAKEINKYSAGIFLADVCGHGIPAALISMRMLSVIDHLRSPNHHPSEFLEAVNEDIHTIMPKGRFVAGSYLILDQAGYSISSAAQPYPIVIGAGDDSKEIIIDGPPLGHSPDIQFQDISDTLRPGDRLILHTDGIIEATNADHIPYGERRLLDSAARHRSLPLERQCRAIIDDAMEFMRGGTFEDDVTLLLFEKKA